MNASLHRTVSVLALGVVVLLSGCRGAGGSTMTPPGPIHTGMAQNQVSLQKLTVSPSILHSTTATPQTIVVSVPFSGTVSASISNDCVGRVSPASQTTKKIPGTNGHTATFTVSPLSDGTASITVRDKKGDVATASLSVAFSTGTIIEYGDGITAAANPWRITSGPDGNIWFTELDGNRIARITTCGKVTEFPLRSGVAPYQIIAGPDGDVWFGELTGNRIGRITPDGFITEFSGGIHATGGTLGLAVGSDGNVWFTEVVYPDRPTSRIGRLTPSGAATEFSNGLAFDSSLAGIAAGPDGNLWFADLRGYIGRITVNGVIALYSAGLTGFSEPAAITRGPDGNVWFTERFGDRIGRITPAGVITEFPQGGHTGPHPTGIITGPDGNIWFSESDNRLVRVTPQGVLTPFTTPSDGAPNDITVGPDGNLWFTEPAVNRIARFQL